MELEILKTAEVVSWAGVVFVFIWKIATPIIKYLLSRLNGGNGVDYEKRIKELEDYKLRLQTNDLHDFDDFKKDVRDDIHKLWNKVDTIDNRLRGVERSVAILEYKKS